MLYAKRVDMHALFAYPECKLIRIIMQSIVEFRKFNGSGMCMLLQERSEKWCPGCETWKQPDAFPKNARKQDGLHYYCRVCHSKRSRERQKATYDRDKKRAKNVKQHYGLSSEAYQAFVVAQGGACAACGRSETRLDSRTGQVKNLHVDHDHETGRVRALLCHSCNAALGLLGDDPDRIRLLLAYVELHHGSRDA